MLIYHSLFKSSNAFVRKVIIFQIINALQMEISVNHVTV